MLWNGVGVTTYALLPGMTATVDVPDNAFLSLTAQGGSYLTNNLVSPGNIGKGSLGVFVDGALVSEAAVWEYTDVSKVYRPWAFARALNVTAGSHQIELRGRLLPTTTAGLAFSSDATEPVLQAIMTIVVLRR